MSEIWLSHSATGRRGASHAGGQHRRRDRRVRFGCQHLRAPRRPADDTLCGIRPLKDAERRYAANFNAERPYSSPRWSTASSRALDSIRFVFFGFPAIALADGNDGSRAFELLLDLFGLVLGDGLLDCHGRASRRAPSPLSVQAWSLRGQP